MSSKLKNICAPHIKIARAKKEMQQMDLAAALSVDTDVDLDQHAVSRVERGERSLKDFELLAFAKVLDVHPMYLLFGENVPDEYK